MAAQAAAGFGRFHADEARKLEAAKVVQMRQSYAAKEQALLSDVQQKAQQAAVQQAQQAALQQAQHEAATASQAEHATLAKFANLEQVRHVVLPRSHCCNMQNRQSFNPFRRIGQPVVIAQQGTGIVPAATPDTCTLAWSIKPI